MTTMATMATTTTTKSVGRMYTPREKIIWFAVCSRAFVIVSQAAFNLLIPDHNAHVFVSPRDPEERTTRADAVVEALLGGLNRWDAQHFVHVAEYGYTYENCLAFFPLFPLAMRYGGAALRRATFGLIGVRGCLLVAGVALNALFFALAADALRRLTLRVLRSESLAYKAAVLFCVNPASVFFAAPYSESLFAWLSFSAMLACSGRETLRFTNVSMTAALPIGLSMVARSNGALNLGFAAYAALKGVAERTLPEMGRRYRTVRHRMLVPLLPLPLLASVAALALTAAVALLPYALVQTYNYYKFCVRHEHNLPRHLAEGEWVLPGEVKGEWCNSTLPISYSHVQRRYWNVGLLNYYQWRQIPNFLLAAPALYIIVADCIRFCRRNRGHCLRLGVAPPGGRRTAQRAPEAADGAGPHDPDMFVYVVHAASLVAFGLLFVHVQIMTRLLASASPLLYWFSAMRIRPRPSQTAEQNRLNEHFRKIGNPNGPAGECAAITRLEGVENMRSKWRTFILSKNISDRPFKLIRLYFLGYLIIGTICFCNFYPWT